MGSQGVGTWADFPTEPEVKDDLAMNGSTSPTLFN